MPPAAPNSQHDEMHVRDLVEVAVRVVQHARQIVVLPSDQAAPDMETYWTVSSCRFSRWGIALKRISTQPVDDPATDAPSTDEHETTSHEERAFAQALLEEIFLSEPLTRVWTAILVARDRCLGRETCESVARSIQEKHAEMSHRALKLIAFKSALDWKSAVVMNRLRRRTERWGDVLIARLNDLSACGLDLDLKQFAFDAARAEDFATDFSEESNPGAHESAWKLAVESLRAGITRSRTPSSPCADLNYQVAWNIVSCFESDTFDATGPFRSLWLHRLENHTTEAQGLVDEYLSHMS